MPDSEIEREKARLAALTEEQPWLMGLSIARVDGELGLVLMVEQGHEAEARQLVEANGFSVPVEVRPVLPLRIRPAGEPTETDPDAQTTADGPVVATGGAVATTGGTGAPTGSTGTTDTSRSPLDPAAAEELRREAERRLRRPPTDS